MILPEQLPPEDCELVIVTTRQVEEIAAGLPGVQKLQCSMEKNGICAVELMAAGDIAEEVFFAFADKRVPILAMQTSHASLEDVFLELTAGEGGEEA